MPSLTRTLDLAAVPALRFYTVESLGDKQSLTPEGFLAVLDVPIARTGTMIYGPNEVPIAPGADGLVKVHRDVDEVFRSEYIASYVGKSVVNDHPDVDVSPDNWKQLTVGVVVNPRRGEGMQGDLLIADFLITDPEAIKDVRAGKREVSCGYDADYIEIGPGEGKQTNMIGNHVALVESGRCGSRCAIGDKRTVNEDEMKFKDTQIGFADSKIGKFLRQAFKAKDAKELESIMKDAEMSEEKKTDDDAEAKNDVDMNVKDSDMEAYMKKNAADHEEFRSRLDALEGKAKDAEPEEKKDDKKTDDDLPDDDKVKDADKEDEDDKETKDSLAEEAPEGTKDAARKARDSSYMEESFQQTVAQAEILSPGIRIPTFDRAANPAVTLDTVCKLRRSALDKAYGTPVGKGIIDEINGKAMDLSGMKCNQVRTLFRGAVAATRVANNARQTNDAGITATAVRATGPQTNAEFNEKMRKHYATK